MQRRSRDEVVEALDRLVADLRSRLPRAERRAGWSRAAADAVAGELERWRRGLAEGTLVPRDVGGESEVLKGLDAWGVDVLADSRLAERVLEATTAARRAAAS